jgi:hypothetical protein
VTRGRAVAAVFVLLSVAVHCGKSDPVRELLTALEAAAEDRDAEALRDRLSDDFQGAEGTGRAEAYAMTKRYLAAYETVRLEIYDVSVTRTEPGADVRFRADFTGTARRLPGLAAVLPPSASYLFDLHVVPAGSRWKVARAQWREAAPSSP